MLKSLRMIPSTLPKALDLKTSKKVQVVLGHTFKKGCFVFSSPMLYYLSNLQTEMKGVDFPFIAFQVGHVSPWDKCRKRSSAWASTSQ